MYLALFFIDLLVRLIRIALAVAAVIVSFVDPGSEFLWVRDGNSWFLAIANLILYLASASFIIWVLGFILTPIGWNLEQRGAGFSTRFTRRAMAAERKSRRG